jgi:glycosyltransferase involved in cell wall biosynthesis
VNICFVSTFPPARCGIATYSSYLIDGLLSVDDDLDVSVLAEEGSAAHHLRSHVRVIDAFSQDCDYGPAILRHVRSCSPDVVHIQHEYGIFGFDDRFLHLLAGLREIRVPVVVTLHTVHTPSSLDVGCCWRMDRKLPSLLDIEAEQRRLCELCDRVVVHQDYPMRTTLLDQGTPADQVASIPHGTFREPGILNALAKKHLGYAAETPLLVAFGYFEPSKNHKCLLEAFSLLRLRQPNAKLWIGGHVRWPSPPALEYKTRIVNLVDELGLREHVTLCAEPLSEADLSVLLSAADVGCFVYREDTYSSSGALHRMLGSGRPIVAAHIPKFHELGRVAPEILVDPDSPEEVARALLRLLDDRSFRTAIVTRILQFAAQTSWPVVAEAHLEVYRRAIGVGPAEVATRIERHSYAQASPG